MEYIDRSDELAHYGIMGMKWGVRNAETKARYRKEGRQKSKMSRDEYKSMRKDYKQQYRKNLNSAMKKNNAYELDREASRAESKASRYKASKNSNPMYNKRVRDMYYVKAATSRDRATEAEDKAYQQAKSTTGQYMTQKYSKQKLDAYNRRYNRNTAVAATAAVLGTVGAMVLLK